MASERFRPGRLSFPDARPSKLLYGALVVGAALLFFHGANEHGRLVNHNYKDKDQGAYLNLAERMAKSGRLEVDGARPPLYPALIAAVYDPARSIEENFESAKRRSVWIALIAWLGFLPILRERLRPYTALALWAAFGLTMLMFYAPYVKAEALYYVLTTWSFLCMLDAIHRPTIGRAALAGFVTGAAQLAKESLLPALLLFAAVQALAVAALLLPAVRRRVAPDTSSRPPKAAAAGPWRKAGRRALTIPVLLAVFLITVLPHVQRNERVFGHYFYNVNSYFYVWYDSWGQVVRGTRAHGDREGWPTIEPEKLPSAQKYLETHSTEQIRERALRGAKGIVEGAARSHGFFDYACFGVLAAAVALMRERAVRRFAARHWPLTAFCVLYFAGYFAMCTWFYAIHPGVRFIAALAPPLMFLGAWLSDRMRTLRLASGVGVFTVVASASLVVDAPMLLIYSIERMKGAGW